MHITRCRAPARRQMLAKSIHRLAMWMTETRVDPILVDMVEEYLRGQGSSTMVEGLSLHQEDYVRLAMETDRLGWDSFVEGRIASRWIEIMKPVLAGERKYLTPKRWGTQFIEHLLQLTHQQWILRNSGEYHRGRDGLTVKENEAIFDRIEELMCTDKAYLLPRHRHLMEQDFEALAEGPALQRQRWIAAMESALGAWKSVRGGHAVRGGLSRLNKPRGTGGGTGSRVADGRNDGTNRGQDGGRGPRAGDGRNNGTTQGTQTEDNGETTTTIITRLDRPSIGEGAPTVFPTTISK